MELIIDIDALKEIMDNDDQLIQECFAQFTASWSAHFIEITDAVHQKEYLKLSHAVHNLKGSLKYLAAPQAEKAAADLETAARHQDLREIQSRLGILEKECQKLIGHMKTSNWY